MRGAGRQFAQGILVELAIYMLRVCLYIFSCVLFDPDCILVYSPSQYKNKFGLKYVRYERIEKINENAYHPLNILLQYYHYRRLYSQLLHIGTYRLFFPSLFRSHKGPSHISRTRSPQTRGLLPQNSSLTYPYRPPLPLPPPTLNPHPHISMYSTE